jgi:hypothetical protein
MLQLILGPVLGIVGGALEKFTEFKTKQLEMAERALERAHDLAIITKEADILYKQVTLQGEIEVNRIDAESFKDSYKMHSDSLITEGTKLTEKQVSRILLVELFSRIIRPLSTVLYQVFLAVIFGWAAWNLAQQGSSVFAGSEFKGMFKEMVYSIIGMAETTLFWYFGVRRMSKKKSDS